MNDAATQMPTFTITFTPTFTSTPTFTPEPTETLAPTITPTSTPDLRIIVGDPEDYILFKEDLPHKYVLFAGDSTPHNNSEVLSARGIEDGKAYLEATGRIGGWIIYYGLADTTAIAPEWIMSYVVMYDNLYGPHIAVSPDWDWIAEDAEILDMELELGDWNRVSVIRERQSNGKMYVIYSIEFIYKNIWTEVSGWGWESDVRHEYIESAARAVLSRMEGTPLSVPRE